MRLLGTLALITCVLTGCATPATEPALTLTDVPADFSIEIIVLAGDRVPPQPEVHLAASRYILHPDGALRYERIETVDWNRRPDLVRMLTSEEVAQVWTVVQEAGLADPDAGEEIVSFSLVEPAPDRRVYLIAMRAGDRYWNHTRNLGADEQPDEPVRRLVRELAVMAWASDLPADRMMAAPRRYNFGADPYLKYRRP